MRILTRFAVERRGRFTAGGCCRARLVAPKRETLFVAPTSGNDVIFFSFGVFEEVI